MAYPRNSVTDLVFVVVTLVIADRISPSNSQLPSEFNKITWDVNTLKWPDEELRLGAIEDGVFSPGDTKVWNIEVWRSRVFICLPRWSKGIAATLVSAHWPTRSSPTKPILRPFPSWPSQVPGGDCSGLQSVTAAVVEPVGRLWILDAGLEDLVCPPKFIIFELLFGGFSEVEISRHEVNIPGVSGKGLRSMVVDWGAAAGSRAYVSDPGDGSLLVYSYRESSCWRVETGVRGGLSDLAISRLDSLLYFTSKEHSEKLYTIHLRALRDPQPVMNVMTTAPVSLVGELLGPSSGLAADNKGGLLYFLRRDHAVLRWDSTGPLVAEWHEVLHQDSDALPEVPRIIFDSQRAAWALATGFPKELNVSATCLKVYKPVP